VAESLRYEAHINGSFVDIRGMRESGALYDEAGRITDVGGPAEDMDRLRRAIDAHAAAAEARGYRRAIQALRDKDREHRDDIVVAGRIDWDSHDDSYVAAADYLESLAERASRG
jgi:hypothetical protein